MRDKKAAARYALAALDSIRDAREMEQAGKDLDGFAAMYSQTTDLKKFFAHPKVSQEDKKRLLGSVCAKNGFSARATKVLETVLRRGRIDLCGDIAEAYGALLDQRLGRQKVRVTSAWPLSGGETADLEKLFSSVTGKKAVLEVEVDRSLVGGIVARAGSTVYDGSVKNQLNRMRRMAAGSAL